MTWRVKPDGKEKQRIISSHRGEDNIFPMPGDADWISVARDSVFLSQEDGNYLYSITFEDGKARLWRLNGLAAEEGL